MREVNTKNIRWFTLLYGLLSLLMLLALLAFSYATWTNVKEQADESLIPHNQSLSSVVKRFFVHQELLLGELAESITLTDSSSNILQVHLNDILRATPQMRVMAVIDSKGAIVATTGDIHTLEWMDLFDNDQAIIGRPFRPTFVGENILPVRKAIKNRSGITTGFVVAAYRLLGNDAIWQEAEETENKRRSMIIGDDGRVYISYPESDAFWKSFVSSKVDDEFLKTLAELTPNSGKWQTTEVQYQDEKLLITANRIEPYNFYIISGIPSGDLLSRWFDQMKYVLLAVCIFLIIGFIVFRTILIRASRFESTSSVAGNEAFTLLHAIEKSPYSVIVTDENWRVEYTNNRLNGKLLPEQVLLEQFPYNLLTGDVATISKNLLQGNNWYGEHRAKEQKQWFSYSISGMKDDGAEISNYVILTQDITERKQVEIRLFKQANFDMLTGLPNRRRTHELLSEVLKNARKLDQRFAVLYMEIDNFKHVNDTFGQLLGSQVLELVSTRLQQTVADKGVACYMSHDQFLVYMECDDKKDIITLADSIMNVMRQPVLLEGRKLFISVSIGITRYPEDGADVASLLKCSDIALNESKNLGRNRYSFFSRELDDKNKRKVELESEIHTALANKEVVMEYQTKNKIGSGEVCGFEALMRWQSPGLGFISPEELMSAAEDVGIIDKLGEFALYEACRDLQKFQNLLSQPITMAVSVSMYQLINADIVETVRKVLEDTGVNPNHLELVVNESMLVQCRDQAQSVIDNLFGLGVSICIDRFGTGYSSLSYLTKLPVSALKIDRSFIKNMMENRSDATLSHTVIAMAHKLGLKVIAEGVEDADQLSLLRVYGCDLGQGHFFTEPLNCDQMIGHLKSNQEKPDWAI